MVHDSQISTELSQLPFVHHLSAWLGAQQPRDLATVVFCGGSLVPKGGQNILEPAAWGKVVFYGPFMEDFRDEKVLLEKTGAGIMIQSAVELRDDILELLSNPNAIAMRGKNGREMVIANMGAADRYAEMIRSHLIARNPKN